jgi:hypothetical protein
MIAALIRGWLTSLLVYLLGQLNPEQKAQTDELFKRRNEQAAEDKKGQAESAAIEDRVVEREAEVERNAIDIANSRNEAAGKVKQVEDAETIEEVLNIK